MSISSDPLVSIIIPVYNVYPYLREALDSVINQTYRNLEIIIVDDGSNDGSEKICDEYAAKDQRICLIRQVNKGLSAARNVGLDIMHGEYVAFIDPDDAYNTLFVERTMGVIFETLADMIACKCSICYTTSSIRDYNVGNLVPLIAPGDYTQKEIIQSLFDDKLNVSAWNKLYKKDIWESIRFVEGHVYEDTEIMFRVCCRCNKVVVISGNLYFHRKRPGSITNTYTICNIDDMVLAYKRTLLFIRQNTPYYFSEEQILQYECILIERMIYAYFFSRKITEDGKKAYRKNIRTQVIEAGDKYGINGLGFRFKTAYNMIRYCPWFLDVCYPIYSGIRSVVFKLTGK